MADPQTIQSLLAGRSIDSAAATAPAGSPQAAKVKDLAMQFEAMLLSSMLKDLQHTMIDDEESPDANKTGPLGDVMTQELGLALSRAGGFGLGSTLATAMNRQMSAADLKNKLAAALAPTTDPQVIAPSGFPAIDITSMPPQFAAAASAAITAATSQATVPQTPIASDAPSAPSLTAPMPAVSSGFGWRNDPIDGGLKFHKGLDLPMPVGSEVRAPADGQVISVGQQPGYGLTVVVDHGNGLQSLYAHLSSTDVQPGDHVRVGDLIARSGNSGRSTGPHLHFEVTVSGQAVDPQNWAAAVASRPAAIGE